jgi:hypothetical protein
MKKAVNKWFKFLKENEESFEEEVKRKVSKLIKADEIGSASAIIDQLDIMFPDGEVTFADFEDLIYHKVANYMSYGEYDNFNKLLDVYLSKAKKQQSRYSTRQQGFSRLNPGEAKKRDAYEYFLGFLAPKRMFNLAKTTDDEDMMMAIYNRSDIEYVAVTHLALNPNLPPSLQDWLSAMDKVGGKHSIGKLVRMKLARNPVTTPEILNRLSSDWADAVRFSVSANNNTPTETLQVLATDEDHDVRHFSKEALKRRGIKEEQEEPQETEEQKIERKLKRLLTIDQEQFLTLYDQLSDKPVEYFISGLEFEGILKLVVNPEAKPQILSMVYNAAKERKGKGILRKIPTWQKIHLRNRVGQHSHTPVEILQDLLGDYDARGGMTMNKGAPPEILDKLAEMDEIYHRNIIHNPNTSIETLKFIVAEHPPDADGVNRYTYHDALRDEAEDEIEHRNRMAKKQKSP